jgi:hypothetical protein
MLLMPVSINPHCVSAVKNFIGKRYFFLPLFLTSLIRFAAHGSTITLFLVCRIKGFAGNNPVLVDLFFQAIKF